LKLSDTCRNTVKSGYNIAQMDFQPLACYMSLDIIKPEIIERFAASQQVLIFNMFFFIVPWYDYSGGKTRGGWLGGIDQ